MNLLTVWENAQPSIRTKVGESTYQTWFSNLEVQATTDTILILTPDEFFKNWIVDHYQVAIRDGLSEQGAGGCQVEFSVNASPMKKAASGSSNGQETPRKEVSIRPRAANLQTRFTFDNFVMGSSNQFAFKASQAVAENPAKAYNPLFIYGQSGMGKTHLMQAIANQILMKNPALSCAYVTSEQFTNELIDSIKNKTTSQFKQKYRRVDVLLIDDIHFLAGKESTQEEFFHTFNELHNAHKQIVLTSDRPAKEIAKMEDRLVTRFTWGLTVDIQPPDFETRVAILRKKVEVEQVRISVPESVIYFIAEQIKTNIRELEGALIRVVASSILDEKPITLPLAQSVLKDMVKETVKSVSLEMIINAVAEYYNVTVSDLKSERRSQTIVRPRQVGMYLARKLTRHSLPDVGNAFGGRDHTTVLHSCKKIDATINIDKEIRFAVEKLSEVLSR